MAYPRRLVILGSTGSVGCNALRVARRLGPERVRIVGLAAGGASPDVLAAQAAEFGCRYVAVGRPECVEAVRRCVPTGVEVFAGEEGLERLALLPDVDLILCAIVGVRGIRPVLAALKEGRDVALASKEVLVTAGRIVCEEARRRNARILPVDSEHSALFQCLENRPKAHIRRVILTASGGPFRSFSARELERVTPEQALAHPTWKMGKRVTVDSATLMNKGLEIIEACRLFDLPPERVDVLVHPGSIVHGLVELMDGGMLAQAAVPDMALPIQYAITWPDRLPSPVPPLDLTSAGPLRFERPDEERFPCLRLARSAVEAGGTLPAVLNAADEIAVARFLTGDIRFMDIPGVIEHVLERHDSLPDDDLEQLLAADRWARSAAAEEAAARTR